MRVAGIFYGMSQVKITSEKPFSPVSVTLTFETRRELLAFAQFTQMIEGEDIAKLANEGGTRDDGNGYIGINDFTKDECEFWDWNLFDELVKY